MKSNDVLEECRQWARGEHDALFSKPGFVGWLSARVCARPAVWWRAIRSILGEAGDTKEDSQRLSVNLGGGPLAALLYCPGWQAKIVRVANRDERVAQVLIAELGLELSTDQLIDAIDRKALVRGWLRMARDETHWASWAYTVMDEMVRHKRVDAVWETTLEILRLGGDDDRVTGLVGAATLEDGANELIGRIELEAPRNPALRRALNGANASQMNPETKRRYERVIGRTLKY
ncbi:MAG TPA: hypothetical protein VKF16_04910 [Candidatus Dormibacteraeota bacterium]|nr:hypothetical protein [Candidatus Dormibacteraeota bacterium]